MPLTLRTAKIQSIKLEVLDCPYRCSDSQYTYLQFLNMFITNVYLNFRFLWCSFILLFATRVIIFDF